MRLNAFLIVALLVAVIAAPIVDAVACDDCKDIVRGESQRLTKEADHSGRSVSSSDACTSDSQRTATAPDLCPVCSNIAAAVGNACCIVPTMVSQANHLLKLIVFAEPSYSIAKPPQN